MDTQKQLLRFGLGLLATTATVWGIAYNAEEAIAQRVVNVAPTGQSVASNSDIAWQFDNVALVNAQSIRVFLNDRDVTSQSILDPARNYFGYRPPQPLTAGTYEVRVEFRNTQGTGFIARWPFTVASTSLTITAVTHNTAGQALGSGANFLATINGTADATATVLLVQNGQTVRTLPATQVSPGVYVATLTVGANDRVSEGVLVGRLEKGGSVVYGVAAQSFAFNPSQPATQVSQTQTAPASGTPTTTPALTLTITSHQNNGLVSGGSGFTLRGTTVEGAQVAVTVIASAPRVGPFAIGSAETLLRSSSASVNAEGQFSIAVPRPTIVQSGTQYDVTVTATRGTETQTVTLRLIHQ
jgi:hypothetical protein